MLRRLLYAKGNAVRARRVRGLALFLAVLSFAGQAASFLHVALVAHDRCAEHGELVERSGRVAGPVLGAIANREAQAAGHAEGHRGARGSGVLDASRAPDDAHGHEHCLLSPCRQDRAPLGAGSNDFVVASTGRLARAFAPQVADAPPIALFRLAPKNSPPV